MRNFYHRILLGKGEGLNLDLYTGNGEGLDLYTGLKIFPNQGEQVLFRPAAPVGRGWGACRGQAASWEEEPERNP